MQKAPRNHIDILTFLCVLALMTLSLGVVYSASSTYAQMRWGASDRLLERHAVKVLAGFVLMLAAMRFDYHKFRKLTKPALIVLVAALGVTLALGGEVNGAARWLRLGGFGIQPSEFAKFALVFHLAVLIAAKKGALKNFKSDLLPLLFWIGLVSVLVLRQPNFSTGAMILVLSFLMLYIGGAKLSHLALMVGSLIPILALYMMSAPYRAQRILSYLGHGSAGTGRMNYQVWQGIIGFGNGGIFGVGPGLSRQRDLFLPESYGDFVFSIVGEEYGLIGTVAVMSLFFVIMLRGMRIARHARDEFGRCLALGITGAITLYAVINAGVTLGILPTTGLPMPFVSYGGSSILASAFSIGVLLNISSQTDMHPRLATANIAAQPPTPAVGSVY
jgi:cell division protein FtsW